MGTLAYYCFSQALLEKATLQKLRDRQNKALLGEWACLVDCFCKQMWSLTFLCSESELRGSEPAFLWVVTVAFA